MDEKLRTYLTPNNLPPEVFDDLDVVDLVLSKQGISLSSIVQKYFIISPESLYVGPRMKELINGDVDEKKLEEWCKMCVFTYALPYFFFDMDDALLQKRIGFDTFIGSMTQYGLAPLDQMNAIIDGTQKTVQVKNNSYFSGFMIRTPPRRFDKTNKLVNIYPCDYKLLDHTFMTGNMHFYVLKRYLNEEKYRLEVYFRGTTNNLNAKPQYGPDLWFTQGFQKPSFDPFTFEFFPEGDKKRPLFMPIYSHLFLDAYPHLVAVLDLLNWRESTEINFVGHSMGGAITIFAAYYLFKMNNELWKKSNFCSFASPLLMNGTAAYKLECMLTQFGHEGQLTIIMNIDDFVNIKHKFGGKVSLKESVDRGKEELAAWVIHHAASKGVRLNKERIIAIVKNYPTVAMNRLVSGIFTHQFNIIDGDMSNPTLPGLLKDERSHWGDLDEYKGSLKFVLSFRQWNEETEFVGKMHSYYLNYNLSSLWYFMRDFEIQFYKNHVKKFSKQKHALVIPICRKCDEDRALRAKKILEKVPLFKFPVKKMNKVYKYMIKDYHKKKKGKDNTTDYVN